MSFIKRRYSNIYPYGYYPHVKLNAGGGSTYTLEDLSIQDSATHLYSFKPTDSFKDLIGTNHGVVHGSASRLDSTISGCQGYANIPGNLSAIRIPTSATGWNRNANRTLEAVFVLPSGIVVNKSVFCGPGDYNDNLFFVQLNNLSGRSDTTKLFTEGNAWTESKGQIEGIGAGEIVAVNIRFILSAGKYEIRYKVENDVTSTTHTSSKYVGSSLTGSGNFYIGGNAVIEGNISSMPMKCHHLAIYDGITTDAHFDDLLTIINI